MEQTVKIHQYPDFYNEVATELAKSRIQNNQRNRQLNPQYNRGDRDIYVDKIGILGEMVAQQLFFENGKKYKATKLVGDAPDVGADITLPNDKMNIDVKATEKPYLTVNYDAHNNKSKDITHYLFVILLPNNTFTTKFYKKEKINNWEVKEKHTKYYYAPVDEFETIKKAATEFESML